jgi:hypothetical protein
MVKSNDELAKEFRGDVLDAYAIEMDRKGLALWSVFVGWLLAKGCDIDIADAIAERYVEGNYFHDEPQE